MFEFLLHCISLTTAPWISLGEKTVTVHFVAAPTLFLNFCFGWRPNFFRCTDRPVKVVFYLNSTVAFPHSEFWHQKTAILKYTCTQTRREWLENTFKYHYLHLPYKGKWTGWHKLIIWIWIQVAVFRQSSTFSLFLTHLWHLQAATYLWIFISFSSLQFFNRFCVWLFKCFLRRDTAYRPPSKIKAHIYLAYLPMAAPEEVSVDAAAASVMSEQYFLIERRALEDFLDGKDVLTPLRHSLIWLAEISPQ